MPEKMNLYIHDNPHLWQGQHEITTAMVEEWARKPRNPKTYIAMKLAECAIAELGAAGLA